MSSSYTNSSSNTYSESRARYVMGKIFDDFHNIAYREFVQFEKDPKELQGWKEDIYYLMTNEVLNSFQIQFIGNGTKEWAVEFEIKADGSIQTDNESGGINYREIPDDVNVKIIANWKRDKSYVEDEMKKRGWGGSGSYIGGDLKEDGAYSKGGFGATKGRRGSWES